MIGTNDWYLDIAPNVKQRQIMPFKENLISLSLGLAKQRSEINIKKMDKTHNLRHLLTELIRTHDLEPKMLEQKVFALWPELLRTLFGTLRGSALSRKTVPVSLSNGILKIYTEYPAYRNALSFDKLKILTALNTELGKPVLTDLRIEIRQIRTAASHENESEDQPANPETSKEDSTTDNTPQVTPEQLEKIEQALASVPDAEVKKSLWQLFTTQSKEKP